MSACDCPSVCHHRFCFHCGEVVAPGRAYEAIDELFCSTRCFVAVVTCSHTDGCELAECADGAPCSHPTTLCCYCDEPTSGEAAHATCRAKVRHALLGEFGARVGAVA